MKILKYSDGIITLNLSNSNFEVQWRQQRLALYANPSLTILVDLDRDINYGSLWSKSGYHHPQTVWDEISVALLEHNIVCAPLDDSTELTPLPGMDL